MSEAFVNTLRRDYFAGADLSTAGAVLDQLDSPLGSPITMPSRPIRRSAINHPISTAPPCSRQVLSASPNCLTKRGTEQSAGRSLGVVPTSPLSRPLGQSAKCAIFDGHMCAILEGR